MHTTLSSHVRYYPTKVGDFIHKKRPYKMGQYRCYKLDTMMMMCNSAKDES